MKVSKMKPTIDQLETINAVIDVCIDRELFEALKEMVHLSGKAENILSQINQLDSEQKWNVNSIQNIVFEMDGVLKDFPVVEISFMQSIGSILSGSFILHNKENDGLLMQQWSCLFWIKMIRAILQKKNREPWISGFDDIVALLERNIPAIDPRLSEEQKKDQKRTLFAYLMELSASARDEGSYGYAERARCLIDDISDVALTKEDKYKYGTSYDRWVCYNKGLAYQHSGLPHKAVLEFNYVISKFWKLVSDKHKNPDYDPRSALEFVFVILPSILQRASISLQLQLGYHALQTLQTVEETNEIDKTKEWMTALIVTQDGFMKDIADNLLKHKDIFQVEAVLQLERFDDADTRDVFNNKMQRLWEAVLGEKWTQKQTILPTFGSKPSERLGIKVRLIEQTVAWFLEKAKELDGELKEELNRYKTNRASEKTNFDKILSRVEELHQRIEAVSHQYWSWVEGNSFDERIYFSRWGKFLDISIKILKTLIELESYQLGLEKFTNDLLKSTLELYSSRSMRMPVPRLSRDEYPDSLPLENFTSDDIPDFVSGLRTFYEMMAEKLIPRDNNHSEKASRNRK